MRKRKNYGIRMWNLKPNPKYDPKPNAKQNPQPNLKITLTLKLYFGRSRQIIFWERGRDKKHATSDRLNFKIFFANLSRDKTSFSNRSKIIPYSIASFIFLDDRTVLFFKNENFTETSPFSPSERTVAHEVKLG